MKDDKLEGLTGALSGIDAIREKMNSITSINEKIKSISEPYQKLSQIANPFKGNEHLLGLTSQLKGINILKDVLGPPSELLKISLESKSMMDALRGPSYEIFKSHNELFRMNDLANQLLKNKTDLIFSHSITLQAYDKISPLVGINQIVNEKMGLYNQHLKLSEQIAQSLSGVFAFKDSVLKNINSINFSNIEKLNSFDVYSASTFVKELNNFNSENELSESISGVTNLLSENSLLKDEIIKLQNTIIVMQQTEISAVYVDKWSSFGGFDNFLEYVYQKILLKKCKLSPSYAKVVIYSIISLVILYGKAENIAIEAKGAELFNDFVNYYNNDDLEKGKTLEIRKHITLPNDISDFTIKNTPIYLRMSYKSKYIGVFPKLTNLKILNMKNDWSFVEGIANIFKENNNKNRKLYKSNNNPIIIHEKVKGWVKNDNLDMFQ